MLHVTPGCRIMLTANVDNDCGLPNGATGELSALIYKDGDGPPSLPLYIDVSVDTYKGVGIFEGGPSYAVIFPMQNSLEENPYAARMMLPIRLSYASSVRKSQSATLTNGVVVGLAKNTSAPNQKKAAIPSLSFFACTRAPSFEDLVFFEIPHRRFSRSEGKY